ncbi:hypothetical protein H8L32_21115 [Undibacterium sp. CY18W]|uniref:Uncharacterized protein n=1 Tax=Undibacterium hunanense TaxID=2762292 RepID=A0ABR6ZVT3_9BURK|nr:hypothetical protein [Undibacterium hunanense]MBC3919984.1 hypothetical protein [Undibacterium hunanense]
MTTSIETLQSSDHRSDDLMKLYPQHNRPSTRRGDIKKNGAMRAKTGKNHPSAAWALESELVSNMSTGSSMGMAVGGTLGMINATLAVLISPFVIPGINLLITQPIEAAVTGAVFGVILGGLIGALLGWGISDVRLQQFERDLETKNSHSPQSTSSTNDEYRALAWKTQHDEYARM